MNEAAPLSSMNSHQKIPCLSALGVIWPSGAQWVRPTRPGPEEVPQLPLPHRQTFNKGRFALIRRESSISYPDFSLLFIQYRVPTEHKHFDVSVIITVLMATVRMFRGVDQGGPVNVFSRFSMGDKQEVVAKLVEVLNKLILLVLIYPFNMLRFLNMFWRSRRFSVHFHLSFQDLDCLMSFATLKIYMVTFKD